MQNRLLWAYIIGISLGDGNLSNPNGRAVRLRITCDARYPKLAKEIVDTLQVLLPDNSVSIIRAPQRNTYFNISVYSNELVHWMPWKCGHGSKIMQEARVPRWIMIRSSYMRACLRGLLQTDGSIYTDRGYTMINFSNVIEPLSADAYVMIERLGFRPTLSKTKDRNRMKYTVRVVRDSEKCIERIGFYKS